jgi:uncharacterized protein (TIGR03435 family)
MLSALAAGQEQHAGNHYDAVAIKPGVPGGCGVRFFPLEFRLENCPLDYLITTIDYGTVEYEIIGLPKWTSSAWYSITAKSSAAATPREQWQMLVPVLEDRFGYKWHQEKREKPVYFLTVSKSGIQFPTSTATSCVTFDPKTGPPPLDANKPLDLSDAKSVSKIGCGVVLSNRTPAGVDFEVRGATMSELTKTLKRYLDEPLLDSTGLTQKFDVSLKFSTTLTNQGDDLMFPSPVAALKKAGLTVTSGRGAVDVLVIDDLQRPSEN